MVEYGPLGPFISYLDKSVILVAGTQEEKPVEGNVESDVEDECVVKPIFIREDEDRHEENDVASM